MTNTQDSIWIELVDARIDVESLRAKIADPDVGAIGWFEGVTRRTTDTRVTERLSYEAHRPMAIAELEKLASRAVDKFSLRRCVIVHRLGEVPVSEASVVVGCSSPHRPATFEALPWIMDVLKKDVPIWKRELYVDGTTEWVHPTDE
jgi:molybdopterin synthase catalytic subunit